MTAPRGGAKRASNEELVAGVALATLGNGRRSDDRSRRMSMRLTKILCAALLSGVAGTGFACTMPPLVAIPAKDKIGDKAEQLGAEVKAYYDGMAAFTTCVQAELAAAGENPPRIIKAVLTQRNNAAVAEATAVKKLYDATIAGAAVAPPAGAPPNGDGKRGRSR
jgi:hypothetical protein